MQKAFGHGEVTHTFCLFKDWRRSFIELLFSDEVCEFAWKGRVSSNARVVLGAVGK